MEFHIGLIFNFIGIFINTDLDIFSVLDPFFIFVGLPGDFALDKARRHGMNHSADLLNLLHLLEYLLLHFFRQCLDKVRSRQGIHRVTQSDLIHQDLKGT